MYQALLFLCFISTYAHFSVSMQPPQSLCAFLGLQGLEENLKKASPDIQRLLAQRVIGPAGWWYMDKQLNHGPVSCKSVTFSDDNELLAVGYESAGIKVWNNDDNVIWHKDERMSDEHGMHSSIAFKPGTKLLAVACGSQTVHAWNLNVCKSSANQNNVQKLTQRLEQHLMFSLVFSKDGLRFVTRSAGTIDFWHAAGLKLASIAAPSGAGDVSISYDNSLVAIAAHKLFLWDPIKNTILQATNTDPNGFIAAVFHPDKHVLVTISLYVPELNAIWDCTQAVLTKRCEVVNGCGKNPRTIVFHPHKDIFAVGYQENGIILYNLNGERLLRIPYEYHNPLTGRIHKTVQEVAINVRGTSLAAACNNGVVPIWRKFEQPTIAHVLLRMVLKRYYEQCIKNKLKPEFPCVQTGDVPPWMAKKFNLKEDEIKSIWESMPMAVQQSIMRTLTFRA